MGVRNVERFVAEFERLGYGAIIEELAGKKYLIINKAQKVLPEDVFLDMLAKEQSRHRRYKTPYGLIVCPGSERDKIVGAVRAADIIGEFDGNIIILLTNTGEDGVRAAERRLRELGTRIIETRVYDRV